MRTRRSYPASAKRSVSTQSGLRLYCGGGTFQCDPLTSAVLHLVLHRQLKSLKR